MFVCASCHQYANCDRGDLEAVFRSRGRCEMCGEVQTCLDCRGCDYSRTAESRAFVLSLLASQEHNNADPRSD